MQTGKYDRRVRFERLTASTMGEYGKKPGEWVSVVECWASVKDILPIRAEETADEIRLGKDQTRVRVRYRGGITAEMRIVVLGAAPRTLAIISGPIEIGRRQELEFTAERFSS